MSIYPGYKQVERWRQATSWGELSRLCRSGHLLGLRVRWTKPDAFLGPAPADRSRPDVPGAGLSADARLESLTEWRQARLLSTGGRQAAVELENGTRLTLSALDSFEVLAKEEG